jgi:hypothetical protein
MTDYKIHIIENHVETIVKLSLDEDEKVILNLKEVSITYYLHQELEKIFNKKIYFPIVDSYYNIDQFKGSTIYPYVKSIEAI